MPGAEPTINELIEAQRVHPLIYTNVGMPWVDGYFNGYYTPWATPGAWVQWQEGKRLSPVWWICAPDDPDEDPAKRIFELMERGLLPEPALGVVERPTPSNPYFVRQARLRRLAARGDLEVFTGKRVAPEQVEMIKGERTRQRNKAAAMGWGRKGNQYW